jgi:hypothetical protein
MLIKQLPRPHAKRSGELLEDRHSRIALPPLDIADIGAVDAGTVGVVFLAPAVCLAQAANVLTQARANIHAGVKTAMSAIDLQTMSDIGG